jgi:arylformamidase
MLYRGFSTQAEIDAEYSPRLALGDAQAEACIARWTAASARARSELETRLDVAYGKSEAETLDIFPARRPNAPVHVFIHGGYWRAFTSKESSFVAAPLVARGITAVILNYALCPAVTIDEIVRQCRAALAWVALQIGSFGGDPGRITVSGHSAGAHLTAMLLAGDWSEFGLAAPPFRAVVPISGLFDLGPFPHSFLQPSLNLDVAQVARNSPLFLPLRVRIPTTVVVGAAESAEFNRQSRDYAASLVDREVPAFCHALAGRNHFTVLDDFLDGKGALLDIVVGQFGEQ